MNRCEIDRLMAEEHQETAMVRNNRRRPHKTERDKAIKIMAEQDRPVKSRYKNVKKTSVSAAVEAVVGQPVQEEVATAPDAIAEVIHASEIIEEISLTTQAPEIKIIAKAPEEEPKVYGFVLVGEPVHVGPKVTSRKKETVEEKAEKKVEEEMVSDAGKQPVEDFKFKSVMSAFFNVFA